MTFEEIVHYRRSVRKYKDQPIDPERVQKCLELAVLAPTSSNMQLWEFYHITDSGILRQLSHACMDQTAASTAPQMVVFVTRRDLFRKRARAVAKLQIENVLRNSPPEKQAKRVRRFELYYGRVMPFLYGRFFGLLGLLRKLVAHSIGLFRPMTRFVSEAEVRVVVHKTCALAAQTFMLAMAAEGYDTCAMEGLDGRRVKRILKLPRRAEVNMIVSCGLRDDGGVWGDRTRIPFEEVYKRV